MHDTSSTRPSPNGRELVIVVARASNGAIGVDNRLPWRLPEDLRRFRELTTGHTVVMGRKTQQSIGRPLPGRENVVVSRTLAVAPEGCVLVRTLEEGIARASRPDPVFCIGGAELYRAALPLADRIELTEVDTEPGADAFLAAPDPSEWQECARERRHDAESGIDYSFVTLARVRPRGPTAR